MNGLNVTIKCVFTGASGRVLFSVRSRVREQPYRFFFSAPDTAGSSLEIIIFDEDPRPIRFPTKQRTRPNGREAPPPTGGDSSRRWRQHETARIRTRLRPRGTGHAVVRDGTFTSRRQYWHCYSLPYAVRPAARVYPRRPSRTRKLCAFECYQAWHSRHAFNDYFAAVPSVQREITYDRSVVVVVVAINKQLKLGTLIGAPTVSAVTPWPVETLVSRDDDTDVTTGAGVRAPLYGDKDGGDDDDDRCLITSDDNGRRNNWTWWKRCIRRLISALCNSQTVVRFYRYSNYWTRST